MKRITTVVVVFAALFGFATLSLAAEPCVSDDTHFRAVLQDASKGLSVYSMAEGVREGFGKDWQQHVQFFGASGAEMHPASQKAFQPGWCVVVAKPAKPAPVVVAVEPVKPADTVSVQKHGEGPNQVSLQVLGVAEAWKKEAGVRLLTKEGEDISKDTDMSRLPWGYKFVASSETMMKYGKVVTSAPVMPPARVAQKATQAEPPTTYKTAFVLPVPTKAIKPAAENTPPSVPQSIAVDRQRAQQNAAMLNEQAEADRREEVSLSKAGYAIGAILVAILAGFPLLLLYRRGSGNMPLQREEQEERPACIAGLLVRYRGLYDHLSERIKDWRTPITFHEDPPDLREVWARFGKPEYVGHERRRREALDIFRRQLFQSLRHFFISVSQIEVDWATDDGLLTAKITLGLAYQEEMLKSSLEGALTLFRKSGSAQINGQRFGLWGVQFDASEKVATAVFVTVESPVAVS